MQCNTGTPSCQLAVSPANMETWEGLIKCLPATVALEASARVTGALLRRREVRCAADLLRMVFAYAYCDCSLRVLCAWCVLWGLGSLSPNALRKRLKHCNRWLGTLIVAILQARQLQLPQRRDLRVRIQDATRVVGPGRPGAEWRVHVSLDMTQARMDGIEVTDVHGGETLVRFALQPGEIRLADRGYAHPRGLGALLAGGGQLVVRINWQNLPLQEEDGRRFDITLWLREIQRMSMEAQERSVWLPTPQGRFAVRLVACPLPPEKAEAARRRARQVAQQKKHNVDERTLLAAGFVLLVSNLPANNWSTQQVLALYRLRWQVETLFKRLKSLLALDDLRAQSSELTQSYLLAKLLGALLLEEMTGQAKACIPADWDLQARPISVWRLTILCRDALQGLIRGLMTQAMLMQSMPSLERSLCDGPRRRRSQLAEAQALLHAPSSC